MKPWAILPALGVLLLLVSVVSALTPLNGGYDLSWRTVDGGGGTSSGAGYGLSGTIGQPDAGASGSGDYALTDGFWGWRGEYTVFLPLVIRE